MLSRQLALVSSSLPKRGLASLAQPFGGSIPTKAYEAPKSTVQTTALDNGVRVVSVDAGKPFPTVTIDVAAGSSYETYETAGTFHFLKYFPFQSTKSMSGLRTTRLIEDLTSKYEVKSASQDFVYSATLNDPSDIKDYLHLSTELFSPRVQEWEVDQVRQTVRREVEGVATNSPTHLQLAVREAAFHGQGAGRPFLAPLYNIDNINDAMIRDHAEQFFTGSRIVVVGNSVGDHDHFVKEVSSAFGSLPASPKRAIVQEATKYYGGEVRVPSSGPSTLTFAFPTNGNSDAFLTYAVVRLLGTSGGRHPGSSLTSRLRAAGERHPALFLPFFSLLPSTGLLGITARFSSGKAESTAVAIEEEIRRLVSEPVSQEEINRAVRGATFDIESLSSCPRTHSSLLASSTLYHAPFSAPSSLSPADVQSFAKRVFSNRPTVVVVGDNTGLHSR